nr:MAG TPA: hypothetical protein [Bacteriophage sp.]
MEKPLLSPSNIFKNKKPLIQTLKNFKKIKKTLWQ